MRMPDTVRKGIVLVALAAIWEIYARSLNNPLVFRRSRQRSAR